MFDLSEYSKEGKISKGISGIYGEEMNSQIQRTNWWLPEATRGRVGGEMGEGGQKVQTSSYKINKSWECNVQHGDYI